MKRTFFITLLVAALLLSGCTSFSIPGAINAVRGSGNVVSETRPVSGFTQVLFTGSGEAQILRGDQESLKIEAEDNLLQYMTSDVVNGKLTIGFRSGTSISSTRPIRYTLTVKELNGVETSGSINVNAGELAAESITLRTSGSGQISAASAQANTLSAFTSGSGSISINGGKASRINVSLSGSGNFNAPALEVQSAHITTSGSGKASVWVTGTLDGSTSGSGDISYYGSPTVNVSTSGSGRARSLGNK